MNKCNKVVMNISLKFVQHSTGDVLTYMHKHKYACFILSNNFLCFNMFMHSVVMDWGGGGRAGGGGSLQYR